VLEVGSGLRTGAQGQEAQARRRAAGKAGANMDISSSGVNVAARRGDMGRLQETCMLTVREGSGRFVTGAPLSKGRLLRAKSGTGGLSNLSGGGKRGEWRIMACKSSMGTSRGAG
jgi:hypothetical protein